jgi:hypothetical protein
LFGGFFGAQKQWDNWVLGIEGGIDDANIKGSGTSSAVSKPALMGVWGTNELTYFTLGHDVSIQTKVDMLASLRGKIGWAFAPGFESLRGSMAGLCVPLPTLRCRPRGRPRTARG